MKTKIIAGGIIPTFGWSKKKWMFWEDVRVSRYKVRIEYAYWEEDQHTEEVRVHVYQGGDFVKSLHAGDIRTKLAVHEVRARISKRARQRIDEIKDALLRHVMESVQRHSDMV